VKLNKQLVSRKDLSFCNGFSWRFSACRQAGLRLCVKYLF
jgi:hypothetical protein